MDEVQTTYVTVDDGARLFVKILGGMQSTKPLLIAIHGGPGLSNHSESELIFGFLSTRYKVLVYDVRGNGFSDSNKPWTHERWVDDVEQLR
jgi:proline iminopeptidase